MGPETETEVKILDQVQTGWPVKQNGSSEN